MPIVDRRRARVTQSWITVLTLFSIISVMEYIGWSQVFAFLPLDLKTMGLPQSAIPRLVGLLTSLIFIFGLPLVPLWGVLADRYSRKLVIARSAVVQALVLGLVALSRRPWELAGSLLLVGFAFGNSGVMLAAIRDVTPPRRLGTAVAIFGATTPTGGAAGPALGGLLVDHFHTSIAAMYAFSSAFTAVSAVILMVGLREIRPAVIPRGSILALALGAIRGVFTDAAARRLFALFGVAMAARYMSQPFLPLVVGRLADAGVGLASAIALVVGTAALVGGVISPGAGAIGDRIGFRPVLIASLLGTGLALAAIPTAPSVPWLAATAAVAAASYASVSAMAFGLLAVQIPPERRSATLNLAYLPLYLAGIAGPMVGALVVTAGLQAVFYAAALVAWMGAALELAHPLQPAPAA